MKKAVSAESLLKLIPEELLEQLSAETLVDYQVKKLKGCVLFKLLLYSILKTDKISQRVIEHFFNSRQFQFLAGFEVKKSTKHTSLSDRLASIEVSFFEQLHNYVVNELRAKYKVEVPNAQKIVRFDSTTVSCSAKLLSIGMKNDPLKGTSPRANGLSQIKFSIGFDGILTKGIKCYTQQNYLNENLALSELIMGEPNFEGQIAVFDRGVQGRKTLAMFDEAGIDFVTRLGDKPKYEVVESYRVDDVFTDTLEIKGDMDVYLFTNNTKVKTLFRLIETIHLESQKPMFFLTNLQELTAAEITEVYKKRWEIEVFFKFLKQEMSFSHLLSRTENGIKVMLYMTMIAAMLVLIYRKTNEMKGYKLAKLQFVNELEFSLIKEIVTLCGGDPARLDEYPRRL